MSLRERLHTPGVVQGFSLGFDLFFIFFSYNGFAELCKQGNK